MTNTLFPAYVKKYFAGVVADLVETINGKTEEPTYLFKGWFSKKFEPTLKYESLLSSGSISAADVVATDSKLPIKMRDVLTAAGGEIPKMGMKMQLREGEMLNIDIMLATNTNGNLSARIAQALFGDVKKVMHGVWARLELLALQSLSQGFTSLTSANNTGTLDVITYAIPTANQFGAGTIWSNVASKPLDDIEGIVEAGIANGHRLRHILMDRTTFNQLRKTTQVKERYAAFLNLAGSNLITPTIDKVNTLLMEDYGMKIEIIEAYVNTEKNGVKTNTAAWAAGKVAFLQDMNIGSLYYGACAEERRPVAGVTYEKADDYMLISKYGNNEPLAEYTSVQAYVLPVLDNVSAIYQLNAAATSWS